MLENATLKTIRGGGSSTVWTVAGVLAGLFTFLVGVYEGIQNAISSCKNQKGVIFIRLKSEQLLKIEGGALTAPLINATTKALEMLYNFGKIVGKNIGELFFKSC